MTVDGRSEAPVTTLRGAGVEVSRRTVRRVIVTVTLVAMVGGAIALAIAGAHRNAQINQLRHDGVVVTVNVTRCQGLLGGSGSNAAGYTCKGAFTMHGQRYLVTVPGLSLHVQGSRVRLVTVPGDPTLVGTPSTVAIEHASWGVFIAPAILLVMAALLATALLVRRRRADWGQRGIAPGPMTRPMASATVSPGQRAG